MIGLMQLLAFARMNNLDMIEKSWRVTNFMYTRKNSRGVQEMANMATTSVHIRATFFESFESGTPSLSVFPDGTILTWT